jgi:hypothetical protein
MELRLRCVERSVCRPTLDCRNAKVFFPGVLFAACALKNQKHVAFLRQPLTEMRGVRITLGTESGACSDLGC